MQSFKPILSLLILILLFSACKNQSPENLPKFKQKFKAQIADFESQKVKTDEKVEEGISELSQLQKALADAQNVDQEFNRVYTRWKKVDRQVENLTDEYDDLKEDAQNLFDALEKQTAGLKDIKTKNELISALRKTRSDYDATLSKTQIAVNKLHTLHEDAIDIIKALEVAIALGQISEINTGLKNIESKVASVMAELNATIVESKDLYNKRIGKF